MLFALAAALVALGRQRLHGKAHGVAALPQRLGPRGPSVVGERAKLRVAADQVDGPREARAAAVGPYEIAAEGCERARAVVGEPACTVSREDRVCAVNLEFAEGLHEHAAAPSAWVLAAAGGVPRPSQRAKLAGVAGRTGQDHAPAVGVGFVT